MTDPTVRDWREMTHTHGGTDAPECTTCTPSPHRYHYPADVVEIPAGTKFNQPYLSRPDGTLVDNDVEMPSHYTHLPVECIEVAEHFGYRLGNVIKYIWRADHKGKPLQDLKKARYYLDREIAQRERS